jgi:hypothetical protein
MNLTPSAHHVLTELSRADASQTAAGMDWYADAHSLALSLNAGNVAEASAVIAALSPQLSWDRNVVLAKRAYAGELTGGCLPASIAKAERILAGETPLDVLGGLKVRSFYANIVDPTDSVTVTVDRHAIDVAVDTRLGKASPGMTPKRYAAWSAAYREAALDKGMLPQQMQAITWTSWRERWAWRDKELKAA